MPRVFRPAVKVANATATAVATGGWYALPPGYVLAKPSTRAQALRARGMGFAPLNPAAPAGPQKTPHGYIAGGDPERFGGFLGNCTSDENFPFYWQCQAENAGNDFH